MPNYIAPAVKTTHEETVKVVEYFDAIVGKINRKVIKRFGRLSVKHEMRVIDYADRCIKAEYGFNIRDMFATSA